MERSRPVLLLQQELRRIHKEKIFGIAAVLVEDDNIFEWEAKITGPLGTPWEGGVFSLDLSFPRDYDRSPPHVHFTTVPFHPNIDMVTGKPCVDFLDDADVWAQHGCDAARLLLAVQVMLAEPVLDNPVNDSAAHTMMTSPHLYQQLVRDCVIASQRIEAGLPAHIDSGATKDSTSDAKEKKDNRLNVEQQRATMTGSSRHSSVEHLSPIHPSTADQQTTLPPLVDSGRIKGASARISFENYFSQWRCVATSQPDHQHKGGDVIATMNGPFNNSCNNKMNKERFDELIEQHKSQWLGKFDTPYDASGRLKRDNPQEFRESRIDLLKRIYDEASAKRSDEIKEKTIYEFQHASSLEVSKMINEKYHAHKSAPSSTPTYDHFDKNDGCGTNSEFEEEEVDQLVKWASNVDAHI